MKRFLLLLILIIFAWEMLAQQVELYFPALAGQSAHISYFKGNHLDSLSVALDMQGKGKTQLPANYKGFIQPGIPGAGTIECIGGEPILKVESSEAHINKGNYINYAIMATPTLYVTGSGIIIGRYASLSETGLLKPDY